MSHVKSTGSWREVPVMSTNFHTTKQKAYVSIIIPAYNASKYLRDCVSSILGQHGVGEILIVDDGSTDDTATIADLLAAEDDRIIVFRKKNGGVSSARNFGLAHASFPYLAFVDADDMLAEGALKAQLNAAQKYNADMTYGRFAMVGQSSATISREGFSKQAGIVVEAHDALKSLISMRPDTILGSCCRILFRTAFLKDNSIWFPLGIRMSEDFSFILDCLMSSPIVCSIENLVYLVRRDGNSATQRYMATAESDMDVINKKIKACCTKTKIPMKMYYECVGNTAWHACGTLYKEGSPFCLRDRRRQVIRIMRKYNREIRHIGVFGTLPWAKCFALKVGRIFPLLFWLILELRNR